MVELQKNAATLGETVKISILMPVYNEEATVGQAIKRVLNVDFPCEYEIVVVDDGSTDQTPNLLKGVEDPSFSLTTHTRNKGKGAAIGTALETATGDYVVVYDADLEYDAEDLPLLIEPVLKNDAQVVFGTRTFKSHSAYSFWYVMGNKVVTLFANLLFNSWISDLETCYKLMPRELFKSLRIQSAGFGIEAEVTGKLLKRGFHPYEVPINYKARSRNEGKKLTWKDGVEALWILTKVRAGLR